MSQFLLQEVKLHYVFCKPSGDKRCDSPGHNTKYLTYFFTDKRDKTSLTCSLIQVSEVGNSNRMEKNGI